MKRLSSLTATLSAIFAPVITEAAISQTLPINSEYPTVANPEQNQPICYMETPNGTTLNLESVCRNEADNNQSTDTTNNNNNDNNSSVSNTPNRNGPPTSIIVSPRDEENLEPNRVDRPVDEEMVDIDGDGEIEENVVDTDNDGVVDIDEDVVDLDGDGVIESDTTDLRSNPSGNRDAVNINDNAVENSDNDGEVIDIDSEGGVGSDTFVQPNINNNNLDDSGTRINRQNNLNDFPNTPSSQSGENNQPDIGVDTIDVENLPENSSPNNNQNSPPDIGVDTMVP